MVPVGKLAAVAALLIGPSAVSLAQVVTPPPQPAPVPVPAPGAQQPAPPQGQTPPTGKPAEKPADTPAEKPAAKPSDKPVDQGAAAAEALRKLLGLKPGPAPDTKIPKGPPDPPPKPPENAPPAGENHPAEPAPQEPVPTPTTPQDPQPQPSPQPQEPQPATPPTNPLDAAERALRQLLPHAKPPTVAPVPQAQQPHEPPAGDPTGKPVAPSAEPPAPVPREPSFTPAGYPVHGSLRMRYRGRSGGGDDDHDLVALLGLDFGDAERHAVTGHTLLRGFADLDGRERDELFAGLDQSLGDDVDGRIYEAWADLHLTKALAVARVGRQNLDETPIAVTFDGVRADTAPIGPMQAWIGGYAGIPVHHFESSRRGDDVFGLAGGLRPWQDGRLRLDWLRLDDDLLTGRERDDVLGLQCWQRIAGDIGLRGEHTWRDGRPHELGLHADGAFAEAGFDWQAGWRELLSTQRSEVTELDPFYAIGLEQHPYRQFDVVLGQELGDHVALGLGGSVRRLRDAGDEGQFNREFERLFADVTFADVLAKDVSLTLDGSYWNSQGEDTRAVAGEVSWQCCEPLRARLGTAYDLYKFDSLSGRERVHVRTWYLRCDWRPTASLRADLAFEQEHDEDERFHQFRLGVTWTF